MISSLVALLIAASQATGQSEAPITEDERSAIVATTSIASPTAAEFSVNGSLEDIKRTIQSDSCAQQTVRTPGMRATPVGVSVPGIFTYRFTRWSGTNLDGTFWIALFDDKNPYRVPTGVTLAAKPNGQVRVAYFPHNPAKAPEIRAAIEDGTYFCKWTILQALPHKHLKIN